MSTSLGCPQVRILCPRSITVHPSICEVQPQWCGHPRCAFPPQSMTILVRPRCAFFQTWVLDLSFWPGPTRRYSLVRDQRLQTSLHATSAIEPERTSLLRAPGQGRISIPSPFLSRQSPFLSAGRRITGIFAGHISSRRPHRGFCGQ